jgi:hypothetical protein
MAGLDVSRLAPRDCVAALRSFPRRFRAVITTVGDDERPDDIAHRPGPDGHSALDIADRTARAIDALGDATRAVLVTDGGKLPAELFDDAARPWRDTGVDSVDSVLDLVTLECGRIADEVEHVDADRWTRTATLTGSGRTVTALDVVREAVRAGAEGIKAAETAMTHARRTGPS